MSNLIMARIRPLNGPLLASAEKHGRREDQAAIRRKVRDEPSLTWTPADITGDPLALSDRLADHVAGAMVPKAKAKALHMLIKLPASVPVETEADARAALELMVQFAQDTYGGRAVFSARMDRDERSLNSVDLFLAPRYPKVTKRKSEEAISLTRFGKLLAKKRGIEDRDNSAKGSMQAQGSALQDELADWLTARGYEAQRGVPKTQDGEDWRTPEMMAAIAEAERQVAEAKATLESAQTDAHQIREAALAEAGEIRRTALAAAAAADLRERDLERREDSLVAAEKQVKIDRARVGKDLARAEAKARGLAAREEGVALKEATLAKLIAQLEPVLAIVRGAVDRLRTAPAEVRRWLDPTAAVDKAIQAAPSLLEQARSAARSRPQQQAPAPRSAEPAEDDLALQAALLARDRGIAR